MVAMVAVIVPVAPLQAHQPGEAEQAKQAPFAGIVVTIAVTAAFAAVTSRSGATCRITGVQRHIVRDHIAQRIRFLLKLLGRLLHGFSLLGNFRAALVLRKRRDRHHQQSGSEQRCFRFRDHVSISLFFVWHIKCQRARERAAALDCSSPIRHRK
ncbi:MAG: hypothetical protein M3428_03650 [Pseudomonadota bacterium]|nr:hypothetical protein [Pseudomonadota bacterium]